MEAAKKEGESYEALCDVSHGGFEASCTAVFGSSYSRVLSHWGLVRQGSPLDVSNAALGLAFYLAALVHERVGALLGVNPPMLLAVASAGSIAFSIYLAMVLKFILVSGRVGGGVQQGLVPDAVRGGRRPRGAHLCVRACHPTTHRRRTSASCAPPCTPATWPSLWRRCTRSPTGRAGGTSRIEPWAGIDVRARHVMMAMLLSPAQQRGYAVERERSTVYPPAAGKLRPARRSGAREGVLTCACRPCHPCRRRPSAPRGTSTAP